MKKRYSKESDSDDEKLHTNHHDKNQGEKEEEHKQHQPVSFTPSKKEILGGERPFRLGIFASSGSGKSHLISEMLTKEEWGVIQKFDPDRVFIICPTTSMDNSYDKVIAKLESRSTEDKRFEKDKQVFEKELESALGNVYKQIFEEQKSKKLGKMKQDANLIILDDVLLEIDLSSPHSMVARILTKCRHANISVLLSTQHLRATAPIARNQLSHAIFFSCPNHKEIAKIREELSGGLPAKQFDQIYNFATQKEHGYLLTCYAFPERYRFFSGQGSELINISKVQSVLISKRNFPTEHDAIQQVERMGYDAHFKLHPDSQQKNFWRFRQHVPFDDAKYITKKISEGGRIVMDLVDHSKDQQRHQHVQDVIRNKRLNIPMGGMSHMSDQTKMGARHALDQIKNRDVHIPHIIEMNGMKFDLNRKRI